MFRFAFAIGLLGFIACGPRKPPIRDAGEEDAGFDAGFDAGRPAGDNPATGYSLAVEQPAAAGTAKLGVSVAMALDQNEQPMLAYVYEDPNGDGVPQDTRIMFTRWNGVDRKFEDPKAVETVGQLDTAAPHRQVAVARDAASGRIGVAYPNSNQQVRFAISDDEGATWSLEAVSSGTPAKVSNPALAMTNGTLYVAYVEDGNLVSATRALSGSAGVWTRGNVPLPAGATSARDAPVSMAVDSEGKVGIAFVADTAIAFARLPGTSSARIADTSSPASSVTLAFVQDIPRVAFHVDAASYVRYAQATAKDGASWETPVTLPESSTGEKTAWYQAVAGTSSGIAVAAYRLPGTLGPTGGPKLGRSSDGTSFVVRSPDNGTFFGTAGLWVNLASTRGGKLYLAFLYDSASNPNLGNKAGVVLWREP